MTWSVDKKIVDESFPDQPVRNVGKNHELFIDDQLIARMTGLERIVNQATKCHDNPVLTWTEPWEGNCTITWGSVLYDPEDQRFKIWYEVYKKFPAQGRKRNAHLLRHEQGRIHLGEAGTGNPRIPRFEEEQTSSSATGSTLQASSSIPGPRQTPNFSCSGTTAKTAAWRSAASPDGVRWKRQEGIRVQAGDRTTAGWDPLRKKFYVITRIPDRGIRTCGLWESEDGLSFKFVKEIAAPDENDPPETQFYGMIRFPYEGIHLGFLEPFFHSASQAQHAIDVQPGRTRLASCVATGRRFSPGDRPARGTRRG